MKENIIVVGGYGYVGQKICKELAEQYPGKVYAAGRSLERAEQFSRSTDGTVHPLQLHIGKQIHPNILNNVKLIIMCLDQTDTEFVQMCLKKGIHYIDISASYSFLSQVEKLHKKALSSQATAVLSVGLSPGLTNLFAQHAKSLLDETDAIDISIMLGLGDQHGRAAIEWTVDNLDKKYNIMQDTVLIEVSSFTEGKKILFGQGIGRKKAYRFDFSDQHVLPQTLDVPSVSTRLCFDSAFVTRLLAFLRKLGLARLLKFRLIRETFVQLFSKIQVGKAMFAVKVDAKGKINDENMLVECFAQGKREAAITAKIAAITASKVYSTINPKGVYHIEQLFTLEDMLQTIQQSTFIETIIKKA
ncbi:saccharopine dehydrogenase family protein [Niallia nealsonii]|uniref:Saccharopine dehydrogenase n=1 Tax=Niallia nealsonii TaxID=115979 RepID=A0A2N0Z2V2_9BACI|nr:saccharopine dehydrogenase NADP-binding domain-containing protein [Niallia nealsonii]PKG23836.1 saccharopine dehydrogenase [Niallia nealsonii]